MKGTTTRLVWVSSEMYNTIKTMMGQETSRKGKNRETVLFVYWAELIA